MKATYENNAEEIKAALRAAIPRALERVGEKAEGYAKDLCPVGEAYGGTLRGSIGFIVDEAEQAVAVGTNVEYAPYVELGTGKYYPGGRPTPWRYKDAQGNWHTTSGQEAQPFLQPAVADHAQTYRNIIEDELKNG